MTSLTLLGIWGLLTQLAGAGTQPPPPEPLLLSSSLVLLEGQRSVVFAYDWNRLGFRAVEERLHVRGPAYRAADIDPARYQRIIAEVIGSGLPTLPSEDPPVSDVYGLNTGLRFHHQWKTWENPAKHLRGSSPSRIRVSDEERHRFAAVLDLIEDQLAELPMQPASALDWWMPCPWTETDFAAMGQAAEFLRMQGLAERLNLNAFDYQDGEAQGQLLFNFAWRGDQPFRGEPSRRSTCTVRVGPGVDQVELVRVIPLATDTDEDVLRRQAFLDQHPELSMAHRALILAGWVEVGMTEAMVTAAWGKPAKRREQADSVWLEYYRPQTATLKLCADRLVSRP